MSSSAPRSCRSLLVVIAYLGAACLVGYWLGSQRRADTPANRGGGGGDDESRLLSRLPAIDVTAATTQQQQQKQLGSSASTSSGSASASSFLSSFFQPKSATSSSSSSAATDSGATAAAVVTPAPPRTLYLAIGILSDRRLTSRRMRTAARSTWLFPLFHADVKATRVRHWFLIGVKDANAAQLRELEAEQEFFGDLLLLPVLDSCMRIFWLPLYPIIFYIFSF